jgi:hypothetical protein
MSEPISGAEAFRRMKDKGLKETDENFFAEAKAISEERRDNVSCHDCGRVIKTDNPPFWECGGQVPCELHNQWTPKAEAANTPVYHARWGKGESMPIQRFRLTPRIHLVAAKFPPDNYGIIRRFTWRWHCRIKYVLARWKYKP